MKTIRTTITTAAICIAMCSVALAASKVTPSTPSFSDLSYNATTKTFSVKIIDVTSAGNPFNEIGIYIDNKANAGTNFKFGDHKLGTSYQLLGIDLSKVSGSSDYTFSNQLKALTWSTNITPGNGAFSWWAVAYKPDKAYLLSNEQKTAATPIHGAAWLLGSGILGLIGLRRRSNNA